MRRYLTLILLLAFLPGATALGIAQEYLPENTLRLMQGTTHTVSLYLQNPESQAMLVNLTVNAEIAQVVSGQTIFNLSPNDYNLEVPIKITAPRDAEIGDEYIVGYSLHALKEQEGGQLGMTMKIGNRFTVLIVDENGVGVKEKGMIKKLVEKIPWLIIGGVVAAALLVAIIVLLYRKSALLSQLIMKPRGKKELQSKKKDLARKLRKVKSEEEMRSLLHDEHKKTPKKGNNK